MENNQQTTCSAAGTNYAVQCGILYQGTEIDTSNINLMPGGGGDTRLISKLVKKATVPDFQTCQNLCSTTAGCKAFNFVETDCTLFSSVSGYTYAPGAVGGTVYTQGEAPPTPIDPAPTCPDSGGKTFTDSSGVRYNIICGLDYAGGDLPTAPIGGNGLQDCLPICNLNDLCAGATFNNDDRLCRFKSSVNGTQTPNNSLIVALRIGGAPAYPGSSSVPPTTVTTTLLPTSTLCKFLLVQPMSIFYAFTDRLQPSLLEQP